MGLVSTRLGLWSGALKCLCCNYHMNRPTLSSFRASWPAETMGICTADPAVTRYCNESQERLLMDPLCPDEGWWGSWITMAFNATLTGTNLYITTPREIARLIVLGVCQEPLHIRNGFYEYLKYGEGLLPKTCQALGCGSTFQAIEQDNVCSLNPLRTGPQILRCYMGDSRDAGMRVLAQGLDQNNMPISTTDPGTGLTAPGEYMVLKSPLVDSVNHFSKLTALLKDETYGQVQIFQVDPGTGLEYSLSVMQPNEGSGWYRRYLIDGVPSNNMCCSNAGTVPIKAEARIDFIPVVNEVDFLAIPNVPALIEEAISIRYSRMDSPNSKQQSVNHHTAALGLLNGQLDLYLGKTSTAVKVPIFGSNRMTRQPV